MPEKPVGKVEHYYPKAKAAAVGLTDDLKVGDEIHIVGHGDDVRAKVKSMQLDHEPIAEGHAGQHIGVGLSTKVHEGDDVLLVRGGAAKAARPAGAAAPTPARAAGAGTATRKPRTGARKAQGRKSPARKAAARRPRAGARKAARRTGKAARRGVRKAGRKSAKAARKPAKAARRGARKAAGKATRRRR